MCEVFELYEVATHSDQVPPAAELIGAPIILKHQKSIELLAFLSNGVGSEYLEFGLSGIKNHVLQLSDLDRGWFDDGCTRYLAWLGALSLHGVPRLNST